MNSEVQNRIVLPNGNSVVLPGPLHDLLCDGSKYYIVVKTDTPNTITDNVFAVSYDGRVVWRIEDVLPQLTNSFDIGRIRQNGILEFYNTDGWWVAVDRATGKATGIAADFHGPSGEVLDRTYNSVRSSVGPAPPDNQTDL
ncbi:MAG: hypothetical protein U0872_12725 [Planctomycetaceae bacterium]